MSGIALPQAGPSFETVGPGIAGFIAIFALAVATVLLLRSMVGHLRKVRYGPDPAAQIGQDTSGQDASGNGATSPGTGGDTPGRDA